MFTKSISDLDYNDIENLVIGQRVPEGDHLDYKEFRDPESSKKNYCKVISSFGNSGGGYLILGVSDKMEIVGVPRSVQDRPIIEWINQITSSNLDPKVKYYDPVTIDIPQSDKLIIVIQVPESINKPHLLTIDNKFYSRFNDSSQPSNYNQIKEMFETSRRRNDEFQEYLQLKNIQNVNDPNFCRNINTQSLYNILKEKDDKHDPILIFSIIPKFPYEERLDVPFQEFHGWLDKNSRGYEPEPQGLIFNPNEYEFKMNGFVLKTMYGDMFKSYFEILDNGYIEVGFCYSLFSLYQVEETLKPTVNLTHTIGYFLQLLRFSKKFYDKINYQDDVEIRLCLGNVLGYKLVGFKGDDDTWYRRDDRKNKHHKNLLISHRYNPNTLIDIDIQLIGKRMSEKICNGFGLDRDRCFNDKGEIDKNYFKQFRI